ncbi:FAD-dependent monooxygenase [Streptomyces avidinii]|uniref:2-polyprenyl-6-methoxyphenol hydroxylase-like FAD-dependent oxidoreductase n=1 Tax=Streptomyces avidinii TaxID=1895 RepID=A0ABS4L4J2_STRAV|nr:FAD-dependent monooxygenase [Streptomyces avidinii]MBP2037021.1 2-polyprenyl-6-methoxyphenol hydroxylase-like FAD-dependent oxidoreductase [Streptomyces avidinii]GGY94665.1 monooxygenase [Streptomyces avidinii]
MSAVQRHAVVAGAGIGGLTAALALHRRGWRVTVCERAPGPTAVGAGIVLAPNALRAFAAIGFDPTRAAGRTVPAAMGLRRPDGRWLSRADGAALAARYGGPPLALHRSALTGALTAALPAGTVRYGAAVSSVDDADGSPVVRTGAGDLAGADLVVAADGIHSPLRRQYFPDHPGLRHSGETAWRTVLPAPASRAGTETAETWGRGERFGVVPLADGRIYLYATAVAPAGHRPADLRSELLRRYGTWHDPIPALLERIDPGAVLQHDLYDLAAPLPRFHHGRLAWLGDAAHAMTPNLGQGGCQAVEDAVVLGHLLADTGPADVPAALAAYSAARCARTDAIRVRARRAGRIAALTHPLAVAVRDLAVRATPAGAAYRAMDALFDGFALPDGMHTVPAGVGTRW